MHGWNAGGQRAVYAAWLACCLSVLLLSGCTAAIRPAQETISTGIHGRLLVIGPARRWQAMFDLKAPSPDHGWLRISHAASGRIIELRWNGAIMQLRDNHSAHPGWRPIGAAELAGHGIVLQPAELAGFLMGQTPAGFAATRPGHWTARRGKSRIQVWRHGKRLSITDLSRGRRAVILLP